MKNNINNCVKFVKIVFTNNNEMIN